MGTLNTHRTTTAGRKRAQHKQKLEEKQTGQPNSKSGSRTKRYRANMKTKQNRTEM